MDFLLNQLNVAHFQYMQINKKCHICDNMLTMQGDFANLLIEDKESVTWQSVMRQMPRHVLAFAARLSTNSLNSPDNLARWGKRKIGPLYKAKNGTPVDVWFLKLACVTPPNIST